MNILVIHQFFLEKNDGGGSRFNEFVKLWAEKNHNVTVISGMVHYNTGKKAAHYGKSKFFLENYLPGVQVLRCHVSEAYNVNFIGRLWGYFSFVIYSLIGFFRFLSKNKYDVVLVTSPPLFVGITGLVISKIKKIPMVFEIRDLWPESAIDTGVLTNGLIIRFALAFEKYVYKNAKAINCLTPAFVSELKEKKSIPENKLWQVSNASDFSLSDDLLTSFDRNILRKELNIENKLVIIYVGAHGVANGLMQMVKTAEMMRNEAVSFVCIGAGMEKDKLIAEVSNKKLDNFIFLPPVSKKDVFKYILAADIGASVLIKADTFKTVYSNKTFDYMACKKPILMAIDGVSRALVEEAGCGIYVEPENSEDFADKIRFFLNKPEEIKQMGESGYQFAKINYDRKVLSERYLKHLESI